MSIIPARHIFLDAALGVFTFSRQPKKEPLRE